MSSSLPQIDGAIQAGRGAAAQVLGQTYRQYRLTDSTSNGVVSGTPVNSAFLARLEVTKRKMEIENEIFSLLCYKATCNNQTLELQDVMVEYGYGTDNGVFTVAQMRPTRPTLWMRTESNCTISKIYPTAGAADQLSSNPNSPSYDPTKYSGAAKDTEKILTLTDGLYSFESSGTPANVQCGLQPLNRIRDGNALGTPTDLYREHFVLYAPMLPGEQLDELHRFSFPNSDRYESALIFSTAMTGLSGYICIVEKIN